VVTDFYNNLDKTALLEAALLRDAPMNAGPDRPIDPPARSSHRAAAKQR
jgi:hypothetical protein